MAITGHYKSKIVKEISSGIDFKSVQIKYAKIGLTYSILNKIVEKSNKCKVFTRNGVLYRKCIYCESAKELNEENFHKDPTKTIGFNSVCKYHLNIKRKNWRILNKKTYKIKHNEEQKRYYEKNKEKIKEYRKEYYEKNKKSISLYLKKRYRLKLKEKINNKIENIRNNLIKD